MNTRPIRFLSVALALVLGLSLSTPALSASVEQFSDVPENYWAKDDIAACAAQGIVTGYDGKFYPEDNVTGVQFVSMLIRTFYADELAQVEVPDGQPWYYPHITVAENLHISDSTLTFQDNAINRYDMARCLYNIINKEDKDITGDKITKAANCIKDYTNIPVNRRVAVSHSYALGILTGISDGTFSGDSYMTRAQACAVIVRMLNLIGGGVDTSAQIPAQEPEQTPEEMPQQTSGTLAVKL